MKKSFLLLLFVTISTFSFSQIDSTKVPFVSYWDIGDSYDFKITKLKNEIKNSVQTKNDSSSYIINFLVIDSTATSYKIKWTTQNQLFSSSLIPEKILESVSDYEEIDVIYETTEVGEFIGIENWEEISKTSSALFKQVMALAMEDKKIDKNALQKIISPIMSIFETKEGIEQVLFKELQYFHYPFGVEFSIDTPIEYEEEIPNMLGGKPIRGTSKVYFTEVDHDDYYCAFTREMVLNPEDTKETLSYVFKKMGIKDRDFKKAMKEAIFDIKDVNTHEYFYYPGVPIYIETVRTINLKMMEEDLERKETIRIELLFDN